MLGAQRQAGGVWLPHGMGSGVALGNPRFHFPLAILQKAPSENSPHCPGDSALDLSSLHPGCCLGGLCACWVLGEPASGLPAQTISVGLKTHCWAVADAGIWVPWCLLSSQETRWMGQEGQDGPWGLGWGATSCSV